MNEDSPGGDNITTYAFFAGYKASDWRLGAEYNLQQNATKYASPAQDHDPGWHFCLRHLCYK